MLPRQRITQNSLTANLGFSAGKNNFSLYGGYNLFRYQSSTQQNNDGFSIGAGYGRQINKWLSLNTGYWTYLNKVDPSYRGSLVNHLQVGGFTFKLGGQIGGLTYQGDAIGRIPTGTIC